MSIRGVRTGSGVPNTSFTTSSPVASGPSRGSSATNTSTVSPLVSASSPQAMESSAGSGAASEVEDLIGDLGPANHIFRQMLRAHKAAFIERLEKMALDDDSLDPSDTTLGAALEAMMKYVATKPARDVDALSLFSLADFGMSKAGIYNVAYYVTQLHESRQKAATATPGSVSSTYSDTSQNSISNSSARRYSWGSKLHDGSAGPTVSRTNGTNSAAINYSIGGSTDYENDLYEEDFEAAEEVPDDEEVAVEGPDDDDDYTGHTDTSMRSSTLIIDGERDSHMQHRPRETGHRPKPLVSQSVERIGASGRSSSSSAVRRDEYDPAAAAGSGGAGLLGRPTTTASVSVPPSSSSSSAAASSAPGTAPPPTRASSVQDSKAKDKTWIAKGNWRIGEKIGSGSFGEVFQGLNGYGKLFAVKRLALAGGKMADLENLVSEIELMRSLSHPNIVEYIGTKVDVKTGFVYIFQEWVPGGSVASMLKKFGPFQVGVVHAYTQQILLGLEYLHAHGIVHRDIKGGNILVDDAGRVKLADFGASTKVMFDETQETQTIKGTPYFMAPEVLSQSKYGRKGDIWAVGCTVIQMLTGEPPWKSNNLQSIIQLHLLLSNRPEGPPPVDRPMPEVLHDFLVTIFKTDPRSRPAASELLQHPFLSDDALEDSMGATTGPAGSMFNNKPYTDDGTSGSGGSTRDLLRLKAGEDANNSSVNLKAKLEMAAGSGRPPKNYEDTMQYIDAQIASRANGKVQQTNASGAAGDAAMRIAVPPTGRPVSSGTGQPSPAGSPITPRHHEFDPRQRASRATAPGGGRFTNGGGGDYGYDAQDSMNYSETEMRSPISRPMESMRTRAHSRDRRGGVLAVGTRVDARYRGRDRWYPGVISRVRQNGQSYDIDYDDGELETHVTRDLIHVVGGEAGEGKDASQEASRGGHGIGLDHGEGEGEADDVSAPPLSPGGAELLILPKRSGQAGGGGIPAVANPFAKRTDSAASNQGGVAARKPAGQPLPSLAGDASYRDEDRGAPPRDLGPRQVPLGAVRPSTSAAFDPSAGQQQDAADYRRRNVQTAGAADTSKLTSGLGNDFTPKSQLTALKSSISSSGGGIVTAVKRRNSKNNDEMNAAATSATGKAAQPPQEMKGSQSEQVLPTYSGTSGSGAGSALSTRSNSGSVDAGYLSSARDSETDRPRSSESAPKRIDPLTRRRPSNADAAAAALAASEEPDHRASALAALSSGPELWRCLKCGAQNEAEEGVDYCNHCSTRRGYSGARGVGAQVIKYG